jgi:hypothetical protein
MGIRATVGMGREALDAILWTDLYRRGESASVTGEALYIFNTKELLFQYMNPFMAKAKTKQAIAPTCPPKIPPMPTKKAIKPAIRKKVLN